MNYLTNYNQTWQAHIMIDPHGVTAAQMQKIKVI